ATRLPADAVRAVTPGSRSAAPPDPAALQAGVQHFADELTRETTLVLDQYAKRAGTKQAQRDARRWKLSVCWTTVAIASGPSPTVNLLDLVALVTMTRVVLEQHWTKRESGAVFQPWLEASRRLESDVWRIADGVLADDEKRELGDAISRWQLDADDSVTFLSSPPEIDEVFRQCIERAKASGSSGAAGGSGGLLTLMGLDPVSGLDPAVREVTRTRLTAERALFAIQRMPVLLRWQVELMTDNVADDLAERVAAERSAIVGALEKNEGPLRELSAEVGRTLAAGERMSTALERTLVTFDGVVKTLSPSESAPGAPKPGADGEPKSPPFDIRDYAKTAENLGVAAEKLDVLLKDANGTLASPALDERIRDAKGVITHAFLLGAGLVVLAFACALGYRRLAPRRDRF
ncbi:MAG TPA: hypothetical protein VKE69_05270, partial [Planctomycetota bacterium]|nr:hypothetical protein [Planctomycetota bacterium]